MTRRSFFAALAAWVSRRRACAQGPRTERHYRTDAQIFVFSLQVFQRSGVGRGRAQWHESEVPVTGEIQRRLEFTGYSYPDRAAGLNRFGLLQEDSTTNHRGLSECTYFGLMTSSPEDNMESARKALWRPAGEVDYSAIQGRVSPGNIETSVARFKAPAELAVKSSMSLIEYAKRALGLVAKKTPEFDPRTTAAQPFLHALVEAVVRRAQSSTCVFGGGLYTLDLRSSPDSQSTSYFRAAKIIGPESAVIRVDGRIRAAGQRKGSEFRIWIEENDPRPLPLRIEYRPKPYLRLTFETETA